MQKTKDIRRATIKDIARESGYSKTAVSFAFNDSSRISEKAYQQIHETAEKLGYIPDPMARNFSLRRHLSIGLLLPQIVQYSLSNPYIQQVMLGIGSVCEKYGYTLTLIPPLHESVALAVRNAAVDGLITMGMQVGMDIVSIMQARALCNVTIDGTADEQMPSINIDDEQAAYDLMKLVLENGHKSIALLILSDDNLLSTSKAESVPVKRMRGFSKALKEYDIQESSVISLVCECTFEDGEAQALKILALANRPTCVVSMSDIVAIGCLLTFKEQGLSIPDDISVVGFDDINEATFIDPQLTTISQPAIEKGRLAAEALFHKIHNEPLQSVHMLMPHT
ncbi:MAG: LacI family transcriptional regulator, partial [Spirochaetia bacterium]|nr:LacI family transcriptional regulator [Spirochaetia bacterium]